MSDNDCTLPHYELNLDDAGKLPGKFGKRIKDCGGTYTACRGNEICRVVRVPLGQETLLASLIESYGGPAQTAVRLHVPRTKASQAAGDAWGLCYVQRTGTTTEQLEAIERLAQAEMKAAHEETSTKLDELRKARHAMADNIQTVIDALQQSPLSHLDAVQQEIKHKKHFLRMHRPNG